MSRNLAKSDFLSILDILAGETNKLIVQTAAGQYIGKIYNPEDEKYDYISAFTQQINNLRHSEFNEDDPTAVLMVDVELRTSSNDVPSTMPFVYLFLDQILGVTIGTYDQYFEG